MASLFELEQPSFGRSSSGLGLVTAANADVTLTAAQSVGAVVAHTPTSNKLVTTATGAEIIAELGPQAKVGQTFEVVVVNLGGSTHTSTFTAGATGVTVTGVAAVQPGSSATFIGRVASSSAVVFYRAN
jgi:2',3'-cyclic-nucleotide 2'-phosphodiesterase (5'-nucleotidase family)